MEIYVHFPFCVSKCRYCDFYSIPCGSPRDDEISKNCIAAILKELDARADELKNKETTSIFVGGGTPTILSCKELEMLVTGLQSRLNISLRKRRVDDPGVETKGFISSNEKSKVEDHTTGKESAGIEFTIECNPGTLNREKLSLLKNLGVNRLSIGLQSADNRELAALGRIHTYEEFLTNYEEARKTGFDNINIDLMSGIPGQTVASCEKTLNTVAGLAPEHISVYSLILEEGTPLFDDVEAGRVRLPDEDFDRDMYRLTGQILSAHGYERYEISNYAKPGHRCRHNMGYWTGEEYLGLGPAAASYLGTGDALCRETLAASCLGTGDVLCSETLAVSHLGTVDALCRESLVNSNPKCSSKDTLPTVMYRYKNPADLMAYMADPAGVRVLEETLDRKALMSEYMILRLRLTEGAERDEFKKRFGTPMDEAFGDVIRKYIGLGLMEEREGCVALTPKGLDVANSVMCEFI